MADQPIFSAPLWTHRTPDETRALYREWADRYDADMAETGYVTPHRLARALAGLMVDQTAPILDFGCGTGLSGRALAESGFTAIDGSDLTEEMLARARQTGLYRHLALTEPGDAPAPGYAAIAATGVVSLGAAPPETLALLLAALPSGGLLAFSYNDPTLGDAAYSAALDNALSGADLLFAEHGPHLLGREMGSTVYILRKS